jgi:hypothetical protein
MALNLKLMIKAAFDYCKAGFGDGKVTLTIQEHFKNRNYFDRYYKRWTNLKN